MGRSRITLLLILLATSKLAFAESELVEILPTSAGNYIRFGTVIGSYAIANEREYNFAYLQPEVSFQSQLGAGVSLVGDASVLTGFATSTQMAIINAASGDYGFYAGLNYESQVSSRITLDYALGYRQKKSHFISVFYALRRNQNNENFDSQYFLGQIKTHRASAAIRSTFKLLSGLKADFRAYMAWLSADQRWSEANSKMTYGAWAGTEFDLMSVTKVPVIAKLGIGADDVDTEDQKLYSRLELLRSFRQDFTFGAEFTYARTRFAAFFESNQYVFGLGLKVNY